MILESFFAQVALALAGGLAAELLHWYGLARKPEGVGPYQKRLYWLTTIGMIALGGLMPVLYISGAANALLCFHLGAATPLLLQKLITSLPTAAQGMGEGRGPSLRDFLRW